MSLLAPGRNLVLVGLMGSGKSTVGAIIADRLQRQFVDTDADVEAEMGVSIAELFATVGERRFRMLEAERIRHVAALRGKVIAVGGGAVVDPRNVTHLRGTGDMVLLDADPEELARRIADERSSSPEAPERPLLAGAEDPTKVLAGLRARRDAAYLAAASHVVDTTDRTPEDVAQAVLDWAAHVPGLLSEDELPP
ncbi:MAG: AAA family ATPase [Nitriliruptorales bacterium]|nr:AAA family ATPase [Nitriliruptorales bacterium]